MTDLTSVFWLGQFASDMIYDPASHNFYFSIDDTVYALDPISGEVNALFVVPGTIGSIAMSPDGSTMLVGLQEIYYVSDVQDEGIIIKVPMATVDDTSTYQILHYNTAGSYTQGDVSELGVFDLAITPDGQIMMTTEFDGSGWVPLRVFPLSTDDLIPDNLVPGLTQVRMESALIQSEHGRYILIEDGNSSGGELNLYDTQSHTIIAKNELSFKLGNASVFNWGMGDISEAAGLVLDITIFDNRVLIFDLNLNIVKELTAAASYVSDGKFSPDGKLVYLWQQDVNQLSIYDTTTWQYLGYADVEVSGSGSLSRSGGPGHMQISDDGRFMFLVGNGQIETLDLLVHTHLIQNGTAADDTLTSAQFGDYLYGVGGNDHLLGNDGDDHLNGGDGNDLLDGGSGVDTVDYTSAGGAVTVDLTVFDPQQSGQGMDTLIGIEGIVGGAHNDVLTGDAGDNYLDGGAGVDILTGGLGNDTYVIDDPSDVIVEHKNAGNDTIVVSFSYVLGADFENLTLTGDLNLNATGNDSDNILVGNSHANILDGGKGADVMAGGAYDDSYMVDNIYDVALENPLEGHDTVTASVSFTLSDNVEDLVLTGTAVFGAGNEDDNIITGNDADNQLYGDAGDDSLDGGKGADVMNGGIGNDLFRVDNVNDVVIEDAGGFGTIYSWVSYSMGANIGKAYLMFGTSGLILTGNDADNFLGGTGDSTLDGGKGADDMEGHDGNMTYVVDNIGDKVVDAEQGDHDLVLSSVSYTLNPYLENLTLTGASRINGTGNVHDNVITGNTGRNVLIGGDGNDTLDGGKGIDTMIGGAGNDIYYVDNSAETVIEAHAAGTDTVYSSATFTLSDDIEKLILTGTANIIAYGNDGNNTLVGNDGNNKLIGGDGNDTLGGGLGNDTLDGGKGIDGMKGGAGDDKYYLDTSADVVTEYTNGGTDTVQINGTYTLTTNVENLIIVGSSNRFGTGNASDNHITGNSGNNTLGGAAGNDVIDGGKGADLMRGGTGDDIFYVDNTGDVVSEYSNAGTDLVFSSVNFVLGGNVENLTLTGTAGLKATGNTQANNLTGNAGNNILDGGKGHDILTGGLGADTFVFGASSGADTVSDFSADQNDTLNIHAYTHGTMNTALLTQVGADTVIDLGGGNIVTVLNTTANDAGLLNHIVW